MTNEIVNEREDETDSSKKNRQHLGERRGKKPFEYASKSSLTPYSQHRSQNSQHF